MKEKSLTSSLQSLHKRQSEYYVKLEKCLSEEKKNSQGIATNFLREYLVSLIDELKLEVADDLKAELLGKLIETENLLVIYDMLKEKNILLEDNNGLQVNLAYGNLHLWSILYVTGVSLPVATIALYAFENRILWQLVRNNTCLSVDYRMTSDDLYRRLKTYPEERALLLLQMLPCSSSAFDSLVAGLRNNDEEMFVETVRANDCNLRPISSVCHVQDLLVSLLQMCRFIISNSQFCQDKKTQEEVYDLLFCQLKDIEVSFPQDEEYAEMQQKIKRKELEIWELLEFIDQETQTILSMLEREFTPRELNMIDDIIQSSFVEGIHGLLNDLRQASLSDKPVETESTDSDSDANQEFTLPDDYFESEPNVNDRLCTADVKTVIKQQGVEVFKEFINYIANEGYIENNAQTKRSFAYRLTGRCRPDDLIERIEWKTDKDPQSYCLYCIMRYFYLRSNGRMGKQKDSNMVTSKYGRMVLFFICKEQKHENDYCKYADHPVTEKFASYMKSLFTDQIMKDK